MLLFDENLSFRAARRLSVHFPGLRHVRDVGLGSASDAEIRAYARASGLTIVTTDADFFDAVTLYGAPPKVIWLRMGNASTEQVVTVLGAAAVQIKEFLESDGRCLEIRSL